MFFWQKKKPSYERAMDWFKQNMVAGQGIIVHTKQPVPYPEVTGYFIPTLYNWGEKELARTCTKWLLSIQLPDGAFPAPDGVPYTFDTGQIMRGLCAAMGDVDGAESALRKACDWTLTQVDSSGRLKTPSTEQWSDIASDLIHTYVLPPLAQAGKLLGVKEYEDAANFVLAYYKQQKDLVPFNRLSHFHAYAMEALCEMGELELARQGGCAPRVWRSTQSFGTRSAIKSAPTGRCVIWKKFRINPAVSLAAMVAGPNTSPARRSAGV
jgi:malonyl-CoA O-methyltransferase